ncbi:hypothetical protein GCM10010253_37900 [Streptomyces badius]|uniref:Galactose-1-epimerase n=1 Tax=Streptomyces badius TaxID=1941 RepID=A0ABQ2T9R9_STRBA|nr:hypothetical protein GCM10010253_37900 [Streptomyces badius]
MPTVHRTTFGRAHGQSEIDLWTLDSGTGVRAEILTYGGVLHSLTVPDTAGEAGPVVRSLPALDDYTDKNPYFGAIVGRYANRIAHGRFTLDGTTHHLPANDRGHALHGGPDGFHTRIWQATGDRTDTAAALRLTLHSPDGDMGFPGALDVSATYTWTPPEPSPSTTRPPPTGPPSSTSPTTPTSTSVTTTSSATSSRSTPTPTSPSTPAPSGAGRRL